MRADSAASDTIAQTEDSWQPEDDPALVECLEQAKKWNARYGGHRVRGRVLPWAEQLGYKGNASNCWIEIPSQNIALPVYMGTSQRTLAAGAGLLENTSLPVGGKPSNCVVTAHSGMPNERMFDGVRNMRPGDKVGIHPLGRNLEYEVEDIETVLPEETGHLRIYRPGEDMLTLVTCTPYGVNDHRLLVHCKRIPWNADDFGRRAVPPTAYVDNRTLPLAVGLMAAGATGIACAAMRRRAGKRDAAPAPGAATESGDAA